MFSTGVNIPLQNMHDPNAMCIDSVSTEMSQITLESPNRKQEVSPPSQTFLGDFQHQHHMSRKSFAPKRASSWLDETPGVIFKWACNQRPILLLDANGAPLMPRSGRHGSTQAFTMTGPIQKTRSKSISGPSTGYFGDSQPQPRSRRSNSVHVPEDESVDVLTNGEYSDSDIPNQCITISGRNRKSSFCSDSNHNPYTGSLSHLIPNRHLMTASRRISVSTAAEGCICASCHSQITPYWRDGWSENVMLCNACGLRFQKFARRCPNCVYIPRKEDSISDVCVRCGTGWLMG